MWASVDGAAVIESAAVEADGPRAAVAMSYYWALQLLCCCPVTGPVDQAVPGRPVDALAARISQSVGPRWRLI